MDAVLTPQLSHTFSFYTITTVQFDETFSTLALRCVLINLSAVFLTDSFFIPRFCLQVPVLLRKTGNRLYLYGSLPVNYSPSLTAAEDAAGCIQAV